MSWNVFKKIAFCIKLLLYIYKYMKNTYINIGGLGGDLGGPHRHEYVAVKCDSSEVAQLI